MNQVSHPDLVAALVKPGEQIKESLTASDAHLIHMTMGICGESGELLDAIKKGYDVLIIWERYCDTL